MLNLRELIKENYKIHGIDVTEDYLDGIMSNKERVNAFMEVLGIEAMEVCA